MQCSGDCLELLSLNLSCDGVTPLQSSPALPSLLIRSDWCCSHLSPAWPGLQIRVAPSVGIGVGGCWPVATDNYLDNSPESRRRPTGGRPGRIIISGVDFSNVWCPQSHLTGLWGHLRCEGRGAGHGSFLQVDENICFNTFLCSEDYKYIGVLFFLVQSNLPLVWCRGDRGQTRGL